MSAAKWTSSDVMDLIRKRYNKDEGRYVVCEQVAPATGSTRHPTWIDAMVISCWPSDGLHRESIEVKVSRSDFLSEINNPAKNAWFKSHSTQFWYATAPGVVVSADEIPDKCGWLLAQKGRLVRKKHASTNHDVTLDASFMASIARSMHSETKRQVLKATLDIKKSDPAIAQALEVKDAITQWIQLQIPTESIYFNTTEELLELLQRVLTGADNDSLYDHIDANLHDFRNIVGDMITKLVPFASELLHDAKDVGRLMHKSAGRAGSYDLLSDLRKYATEKRYKGSQRISNLKTKIRELEALMNCKQEVDE